jgi:hypothetical protein
MAVLHSAVRQTQCHQQHQQLWRRQLGSLLGRRRDPATRVATPYRRLVPTSSYTATGQHRGLGGVGWFDIHRARNLCQLGGAD